MNVTLPTSVGDFRLLARTLRLVLTIPLYAVLTVFGAFGFLTAIAIWNQWELFSVLTSSDAPYSVSQRFEIFTTFYPLYGDNFQTTVEIALIAIAILVGINLSMLLYHLREHDLSVSGGSGSAVGVILGVLGAGCAACGSALLVGVLTFFGAGGLIATLPLHGVEVSFLAVPVMLLSTYWIADGMRGGEVRGCPIDAGGYTTDQ
jgi:hypothetical protein